MEKLQGPIMIPAIITGVWLLWAIYKMAKPNKITTFTDCANGVFEVIGVVLSLIPILVMWIIYLIVNPMIH